MKELADEHFTKVKWCKNYIQEMRKINYRKLDEATAYVLKVRKMKMAIMMAKYLINLQ